MRRPKHFEYAIKKDVRNNPIVREVDRERHRELWRSVGIGAFLVSCSCSRRGSTSSCCARLPGRADAAGARRGGRDQPAPPARDRDAGGRRADRAPGDRRLRMVAPARRAEVIARVRRRTAARPVVAQPLESGRVRGPSPDSSRLAPDPAAGVARGALARCGRSASRCGWSTCRSSRAARSVRARRTAAVAHDRSAGQARRHPRSQRRGARLQRRRRHDLRRAAEIDDPDRGRRGVRALDDCDAKDRRRRWPIASSQGQAFATCVARCRRSGAAGGGLQLDGIGFMQGEPAPTRTRALASHCSATSASTTSAWAASRRPTTRSSAAAPAPCSCRPTRGGARSAASSGPPTAGASLELTIDSICSTSSSASCAPACSRAAPPAAVGIVMDPSTGRDSGAGQRARLQSQRLSRRARGRAAQSRRPGSLRAGIDLQDRHRQRRLRRGRHAADTIIDAERRQHPIRLAAS